MSVCMYVCMYVYDCSFNMHTTEDLKTSTRVQYAFIYMTARYSWKCSPITRVLEKHVDMANSQTTKIFLTF